MSIAAEEMVIEKLVRNVRETGYESFTRENIDDIKDRMIDIVGCAIGGAHASGNQALLDVIREWGGRQEATIWVHGDRVPLESAVLMNCIMSRSYDYEVCGPHPAEPLLSQLAGRHTGHIPATIDPAALTMAGQCKATGKDLIAAAILGGDLAARLVNAVDFDAKQVFDFTGTANGFGAAAVAGRLWGLNEAQLLNALGILVNLLSGGFQSNWDGCHTFKLPQGESARNAVFSARLARRGFTGIKDPLFSAYGYFQMYCQNCRGEFLTLELGKAFHTKGDHKLYPSCYGNHAAIECCEEILRQGVNAGNIAEVTAGVRPGDISGFPGLTFGVGDSVQKALFNIRYSIASVLVRGGIGLEHYSSDEAVNDPAVIALCQRIKLVPNAGGVTDVKVRTEDGKEYSAQVPSAKGRAGRLATRQEIKDKFWLNVEFSHTIPHEKAARALDLLENLEAVDDVSRIVRLLVV